MATLEEIAQVLDIKLEPSKSAMIHALRRGSFEKTGTDIQLLTDKVDDRVIEIRPLNQRCRENEDKVADLELYSANCIDTESCNEERRIFESAADLMRTGNSRQTETDARQSSSEYSLETKDM